jgi:hypothetical protein
LETAIVVWFFSDDKTIVIVLIRIIRSLFLPPMIVPTGRQPLGFKCPKCGRDYGSLRIKIVEQKFTQENMTTFKTKKDDQGEKIKVPVKRNLHTYKYDTIFGDFDPNRKPIINLPEPTLGESSATVIEKMEKFMKRFVLLPEIIPVVLKKHPELVVGYKDFTTGIRAFLKYINPLIDNKWDRSWVEWTYIAEYAKDHGYNAASRRFPAIKDGKNTYLSPHHIKKKVDEVCAFSKHIEEIRPSFFEYTKRLHEIIRNDDDIMKKYIQLAKDYDENIEQGINTSTSKINSQTYYYIRHYDPLVYRQRKSDYKNGLIKKKSQVNGRIECGPFKQDSLLRCLLR